MIKSTVIIEEHFYASADPATLYDYYNQTSASLALVGLKIVSAHI